ncbi:MAG TPA: zinc ribbon domain-containing protein [Longimicrobium sp.]|uniref:zinc ribbon domain-containing protein n=1 Tax=Longimicrobium sp. TaxID=2029185 RepID=UPI002ED8FBE9
MMLLIVSLLLALLAAGYVVRPVVARRDALLVDLAPGAVMDAEARRRVALASLKELEYDYLGGKLDTADYQAQKQRMSLEALATLRAAEAARSDAGLDGGGEDATVTRTAVDRHACGFVNPAGSRFCAGCGVRLA